MEEDAEVASTAPEPTAAAPFRCRIHPLHHSESHVSHITDITVVSLSLVAAHPAASRATFCPLSASDPRPFDSPDWCLNPKPWTPAAQLGREPRAAAGGAGRGGRLQDVGHARRGGGAGAHLRLPQAVSHCSALNLEPRA